MKILVCLPTRNEIKSVDNMIDRITALGLDLMICDQDSTDGTIARAKAKEIPVYQRDGYGKGWGVRKALAVAKEKGYEFLVMIDCDCTYLPEEIPSLMKFIPDNDMVIGVRNLKAIQFSHRLVNILHTQLINILFGADLKDINSGLRIMKVSKFNDSLDAEGFDIEAQITAAAVRDDLRIKEVPIEYKKRVGTSKIRAWDTFNIIKRIIIERFKAKKSAAA